MFDIEIYNGDINFANGQFVLVIDGQKLVQSLVKILITPQKSDSLRPNYGTDIANILGHAMPEFIYTTKIEESVSDAIRFLITEQSKASYRQYVSPGERIKELIYVNVVKNTTDSRQIDIYIGIRAGDGNIIERQFALAPGAYVSQRIGNAPPASGGY